MSSCAFCFEFTGIFSKQLQTEVIRFLNALAIGMISLLRIQMRNFPVRVQPLVAMFSPSVGKSAFLCGRIRTASKINALQAGSSALWKEAKGSSSLEKASDLTSSNSEVLGYRKGLFYLTVLFFFFSSGMNIAR